MENGVPFFHYGILGILLVTFITGFSNSKSELSMMRTNVQN